MKSIKIASISLLLALFSSPAFAERLEGSAVVELLSKGRLEFQAGSVWKTLPGNKYVFNHKNSSEEGTFKIYQNGEVHILDEASGETIKFYFQNDDGVISLTYLSGPGKGRTYPLK